MSIYKDLLLSQIIGGGGGPSVEVVPLSVTENGTYSPEEGQAYAPVEVNVPQGVSANDAVRFLDYDGTIVYSYTPEEFLALDAMPENPQHEGLISQGWNWSFADAKVYVTKYNRLTIGQSYITDDGKTRLYISIENEDQKSPTLYWCQNRSYGVVIDWGDGTGTESVAGSSGVESKSHTYSTIGNYIITLEPLPNCTLSISNTSSLSILGPLQVHTNSLKKVFIGSRAAMSNYSFYNCYSLQYITIPNGINWIPQSAFQGCYSLSSIVIPNGVTRIDNNVFSDCRSLSSISIPKGVPTFGSSVFNNCTSLHSIEIPDGVTSLGGNAFYGCTSLSSVIISDTVTSIGSYVFQECRSLSTIVIPDGVTNIDGGVFRDCTLLSSVKIPSELTSTSIGDYSFMNCYCLSSIKISKGVTHIGNNAFSSCRTLSSVEIPDGVTSIGNSAFSSCTLLSSIKIPNGVTSIGSNAFSAVFMLYSVEIPEGVTSLGGNAFGSCVSLSYVKFPDSLATLEYGLLQNCRSLSIVDFSSVTDVPTLSATSAFPPKSPDYKIVVPDDLYDSWVAATNWSFFASKIVKASEVQ